MPTIKPSIPKGTRDFNPEQVIKRNFITDQIRKVYELYAYSPIETPVLENLSTLTGKFGDEGDKLLFKVLNSGNFLAKAEMESVLSGDYVKVIPSISSKGLRYDLTVPFARYVVMHQNEISFPFRRYQIQPVWRADRPQKGRYQEFYQCDADVIGSDSLINDAEFVLIFQEVFKRLGIGHTIKINNRKILNSMAVMIGASELFTPIMVAVDKLDKIGEAGVMSELSSIGLDHEQIDRLFFLFNLNSINKEKLDLLHHYFKEWGGDTTGIEEMDELFTYLNQCGADWNSIQFDPGLARGLSYYTGTIYEVICNDVGIGSIAAGGRYDDLTGVFGLPGVSGVGISFGLERIYDVMEELALFPGELSEKSPLLILPFDKEVLAFALDCLQRLRSAGVAAELYPELNAKMKKKMKFADQRKVRYVALIGTQERNAEKLALKDMQTGEQHLISLSDLIEKMLQIN